ncbi:MAG: hypothetical protein WDO24_27595 [Pseudomonadota bacterium]
MWLLLLAFPFAAPNSYVIGLGVLFCLNAVLIGSLNLLMGHGGQISLSHGAFYGLGAYASGVLSVRYGWSPWLGLAAAAAVTAAAALVIGLPALRLRGHYLAMATLGFNAIMTVLFYELVPLTGGADGLGGIPSFDLFGFALGTDRRFFYFAWVVAGLLLLLMLNLIDSRVGRALRALSTSELAAASMGVDTYRTKLQLFVLSAVMAAIAGALFAHFNNFVTPRIVRLLRVGPDGRDGRGRRRRAVLGRRAGRPDVDRAARVAALDRQLGDRAASADRRLGDRDPDLRPQHDPGAAVFSGRVGRRLDGAARAAGAMTPLLAVQGLRRQFGGVVAVAGLDFELARGLIKGIIGPNGAGKTTLFNPDRRGLSAR